MPYFLDGSSPFCDVPVLLQCAASRPGWSVTRVTTWMSASRHRVPRPYNDRRHGAPCGGVSRPPQPRGDGLALRRPSAAVGRWYACYPGVTACQFIDCFGVMPMSARRGASETDSARESVFSG